MAKYDLESLLADVKSVMTSNLNTRLAAIDTEKNDGTTLATVNASAYFCQDINHNTAVNYDPFIYYGLEDTKSTGTGPGTSHEHTIIIALVKTDNGQENSIINRLFRYQRALREIFEENYSAIEGGRLSIESLTPIDWGVQNSSQRTKAIGILLTVGLA